MQRASERMQSQDAGLARAMLQQEICIDLARAWFSHVQRQPGEHVVLWELRLWKEYHTRGFPGINT